MAPQNSPSETQQNMLDFIWQYLRQHGMPPAYRDIEKGIGASSVSVVSYHVQRLETMGLLNRQKNVARSLRLTSDAIRLLGRISDAIHESAYLLELRIVGDIAAGVPVDPGNESYDPDDTIGVDVRLLPKNWDELYAVRVLGTSMIDALVNDGDVVVLYKTTEIRNGDMVAVWLPLREEMTLKHIYREGDMARLQPANRDYKALTVPGNQVDIQGKVILIQRLLRPSKGRLVGA